MRPPADFESREGANRRLTVVLAVLFYALAFRICRYAYGNALGFAASSPVLGVYFSWWLLNRGGGGLRWARWLALRKVDGRYYAFQDVPVDVRWQDGRCIVRAADVFRVVGEQPDERLVPRLATRFGPEQFFRDDHDQWWFGETAVLDWLTSRAARFDTVARKFRRWLELEVFAPLRRRHEIG